MNPQEAHTKSVDLSPSLRPSTRRHKILLSWYRSASMTVISVSVYQFRQPPKLPCFILSRLKGILRQALPGSTLPGRRLYAWYMRLTMRHDGTRLHATKGSRILSVHVLRSIRHWPSCYVKDLNSQPPDYKSGTLPIELT